MLSLLAKRRGHTECVGVWAPWSGVGGLSKEHQCQGKVLGRNPKSSM